jgi:hypothetical protein
MVSGDVEFINLKTRFPDIDVVKQIRDVASGALISTLIYSEHKDPIQKYIAGNIGGLYPDVHM